MPSAVKRPALLVYGPKDGHEMEVPDTAVCLTFNLVVGAGHSPDGQRRQETHIYKLTTARSDKPLIFRWHGFTYTYEQ